MSRKEKAAVADKAFWSLRAQCALQGIELMRTDTLDGPVRVFVAINGAMHAMPSIEAVRRLVGSAPGRDGQGVGGA